VNKKLSVAVARSISLDDLVSNFISEINKKRTLKAELGYIKEKEKALHNFIKEGKSPKLNPENQLIILRKWNSYTPVLPPTRKEYLSKGGGYFIRIGDLGIVIDPGFNFIENFLNSGFRIDDIDHVFISHAHNDHTVELEGLFSLLFKRNEESRKPKQIRLYMNLGSFKKFTGYFDLSSPPDNFYIENIVILNMHQLVKINEDIDVFTTRTQHHEMITKDYALGFTFRFRFSDGSKKVIKFTSDTGWNEDIEGKNKEEAASFGLDHIDILVAHIGSIKEKELDYVTSKTIKDNRDKLYKNHLGLIGTVLMLNFWKPSLLLISEFGEEMNAVRKKIAEIVGAFFRKPIFSTDLNFRIDINTLNIYCFKSKKFYDSEDIETYSDEAKGQLYYLNPDKLTAVETQEKSWLGRNIWDFKKT
jgi:hypothetical protein